jgi:hypothetical protein
VKASPAKPAIIIAQVEGSGIDVVISAISNELLKVSEPSVMVMPTMSREGSVNV